MTICLDSYILDVLMRDLTEHEKRPLRVYCLFAHLEAQPWSGAENGSIELPGDGGRHRTIQVGGAECCETPEEA